MSFGGPLVERGGLDHIHSELIKTIITSIRMSPSISDATIVLRKRVDKDLSGSIEQIGMEIARPYIADAISQTHKVLGSLDLLGNPSAALRHLNRGCRNAFQDLQVAVGLNTTMTPHQREKGACHNFCTGCLNFHLGEYPYSTTYRYKLWCCSCSFRTSFAVLRLLGFSVLVTLPLRRPLLSSPTVPVQH